MDNGVDLKQEKREGRGSSSRRWLYFFLGVLLAASVGLAIALILAEVKDDDKQPAATSAEKGVTMITKRPGATTQRLDTTASSGEDTEGVCVDASCVLRAGELLAAMDTEVDPCKDFYQYSCGNWIKTHSIPESESSYSRFGELRNNVRLELKGLLEQPYNSGTESDTIRKAKQLYQSCLDEDTLTKKGVEPLKTLVDGYGPWPLTQPKQFRQHMDLESTLVDLAKIKLSPLLDVGVYQDDENSSMFITWISQPGFGIDRDYMVKGRNSTEVMTYEELLRQLAIHVLGLPSSQSLDDAIGDVVEFEVKLAKLTPSRGEMRNTEMFYKKIPISQLQTTVPKFNWTKFLKDFFEPVNITLSDDDEVVLFAEKYLNDMLDLYKKTDQRIVANYLLMRSVDGYSGYLSKEIRDLNAPIRKVLYGVTQTRARWKTCVDRLGSTFMPTAVGQLYVNTYFSPAAKHKALEMIGDIRESMKEMISDVTWMDDATKHKALEKADAIIEKIGYPDYQFNETVLEEFYKDVDYHPETYFENGLDYYRSVFKDNSLNLLRVPRRTDWGDSASTVNAFYSSADNTITFPAGILQPPFYGEDFPMSMMFGGIGMVIGHEMTHGFDDQGRKYDKEGNNIPWWSNSSVAEYKKLTQCFVDQYSEQVVVGMHVNGQLTLGENIADNGGIKAAFMAFERWQRNNKKQPLLPGLGLSHEQLFFINFAQGWCDLTKDESAKNGLLTDPHSPDGVRVHVTASNSPQFAKAFSCPQGSPMNPDKRCHLW
ncbi:endothelin-converting enzyme 1-like [Littorina saxatilis]|uniref:Uncharacterized protein n=1 Tax=Littorina saxatilis TaxID=31220 RepID=A0AAN9AV23_9CAEN